MVFFMGSKVTQLRCFFTSTNVYKLDHKIKTNVDLMGMEQTRATALEIETLGKSVANMNEIEEKFPLLKKDVLQVISELKKDFDL